jgi:hypothetical protein
MLNHLQIRAMVHRCRSKEFYDWEAVIQSAPLVQASDTDERPFLQFNLCVNTDGTALQKIIGWAHPAIIFHVKSCPVNIFIDCTFRVPKGFTQCMIVMAYLAPFDEYVPLTWILLQSKTRNTYQHALANVIAMTDFRLTGNLIRMFIYSLLQFFN